MIFLTGWRLKIDTLEAFRQAPLKSMTLNVRICENSPYRFHPSFSKGCSIKYAIFGVDFPIVRIGWKVLWSNCEVCLSVEEARRNGSENRRTVDFQTIVSRRDLKSSTWNCNFKVESRKIVFEDRDDMQAELTSSRNFWHDRKRSNIVIIDVCSRQLLRCV